MRGEKDRARLAVLRLEESITRVVLRLDPDPAAEQVDVRPVERDQLAEPCARLRREASGEEVDGLDPRQLSPKALESASSNGALPRFGALSLRSFVNEATGLTSR